MPGYIEGRSLLVGRTGLHLFYPMTFRMSTVLFSDAHLGNVCSRPARLLDLLAHLPDDCDRLIVVGDLGDLGNGVDTAGFAVWQRLQALADTMEVVLLPGNHDPANSEVAEALGLFVGGEVFRWASGGRSFAATHGHRHPVTHDPWDPYEASYFSGHFYPTAILNALERSCAFWGYVPWLGWNPGLVVARWFHSLRKYATPGVRQGVRYGAVAYGLEVGVDVVFCGHSHLPEQYEHYVNIGACGAEPVVSYAVERQGVVTLCRWWPER